MPSMLLMEADVEEGDHSTLGSAAQGTDESMDGECEYDTGDVYDLYWTISAMPAEGEEVETDIVLSDVDGVDDVAVVERPPPFPERGTECYQSPRKDIREIEAALSYAHTLQQILSGLYG